MVEESTFNDRKPWEQFTVCICDKCGEAFEPDREHICRKKNSYPGFVNEVTGGYVK